MGLLDTELGKRRLLAVEVPAIEAYNDGRDPDYRIAVGRIGGVLVLSYRLKPCHNVYRVETRLLSSYPVVPPKGTDQANFDIDSIQSLKKGKPK